MDSEVEIKPKRSTPSLPRLAGWLVIFFILCAGINVTYLAIRLKMGNASFGLNSLIGAKTPVVEQVEVTQEPAPFDLSLPAVLAGMNPQEINIRLEKAGFDCSATAQGVSGYYQSRCDRTDASGKAEVYHFGRSAEGVDLIDINFSPAVVPDDGAASSMFAEVLSLLNVPGHAEISFWAADTLPTIGENRDIRENTIAGTSYKLDGAPANRSLEAGKLIK